MWPPFKTSISILVDKSSVSMDSKRCSSLTVDGQLFWPSHSLFQLPLCIIRLKIDTVTHWCHLKTRPLLYSTEKVDFPVLCCWCVQTACLSVLWSLSSFPVWAADFPPSGVLLDFLPLLCLAAAFLFPCQLFVQAAGFPPASPTLIRIALSCFLRWNFIKTPSVLLDPRDFFYPISALMASS